MSYLRYSLLSIAFVMLSLFSKANTGADMVKAAESLLSSLSDDQRARITFEVNDTSREIWHYLPLANFSRFGIPLRDLNPTQDALVYHMLEVSLSAEGYDKARQIMDLENVLKIMENNSPRRDPEQYHIAIYGTPSLKGIWSWSLSGHHVSLHFTVVDGEIASTPTFLGSNPAEVRQGEKKGLRVLHDEEDKGLTLVQSLTEEQKKQAVFADESPYEIFTGAKSEVSPLEDYGIHYSELNESQQNSLRAIIEEYIAVMPAELAKTRHNKVEAGGWDDIQFAWAGVTDRSAGHYYRIQGPSFLIEFDNTQNDANHIHTVWRDFDGDFGRDLLKEHYNSSH